MLQPYPTDRGRSAADGGTALERHPTFGQSLTPGVKQKLEKNKRLSWKQRNLSLKFEDWHLAKFNREQIADSYVPL